MSVLRSACTPLLTLVASTLLHNLLRVPTYNYYGGQYGCSFAHHAAAHGLHDCLQLAIAYGADVNAKCEVSVSRADMSLPRAL